MLTPKWALQKIREAKLENSTVLDLKETSGFGNAYDPLDHIPDEVFELTQLRELSLGNNALVDLPESIINLQGLTYLDIGSNRFSKFPELVTRLPNLTVLNLSKNGLGSLSNSIAQLYNLRVLNLSSNQLTSLPDAIYDLKKLRVLRLYKNQLSELKLAIVNLQDLESLDLRRNQFIDLPEFVAKLQNLIELRLDDNPLRNPPLEVAIKGIEAVREYFRQLAEQGQDQLFEAKLLILGEGGAGKTTLAKKIKDSKYVLREETSTEGIDVTTWSFSTHDGRPFRVNIWDFGGQDIYHSTHQFFLTKRSLYTLVADTRKEDTDFYYWMNVVELLSDNSPLLIVKNEKQDRHREINERQLRGQFENLKEIISSNLATNRGLDRIREEVKHYVSSLPHIGSSLPKAWVRVREILERDYRSYISLENYFVICRRNGFEEMKDCLQLSGYLHDIGVFLHFQDDPLLNKTVFLKPKWATDAVYKVLDNKKVARNLGTFSTADLAVIWNSSMYENMHAELLHLMMKFKLCYEIPANKGTYIAPQLLTENQPEYQWDEKDNLLLRYTYEFMPKGILTQFIVAMHPYIVHDQKRSLVWRSGVIISREYAIAEIIEHYGKRQIFVRIAGTQKRAMMAVVMHELDKIHSTYKRLKYDKLIPCNCEECKKKGVPYFYLYETLQKFVADRQIQIQCQQSYKMVNVMGLIDDVLGKEFVEKENSSPMAQYIIHGDYIDQGDKKMADNKISINNSTIHGSVVAAESIQESFNAIEKADIRDDLKEQLKRLTQAVEKILGELPKEQAEEAAEAVKILAEQVVKEKPNPRWYNVSIDGLILAAQNLGKVGDEVVELAGKVRKILTGGLL